MCTRALVLKRTPSPYSTPQGGSHCFWSIAECPEEGVDYYHHDLEAPKYHKTKTAEECYEHCQGSEKCYYFTFDRKRGYCYAKDRNAGEAWRRAGDMVSGSRHCVGFSKSPGGCSLQTEVTRHHRPLARR